MNRAFVYAERQFAALQAFQFGQPLLYLVAEVEETFGVLLKQDTSVGEADRARPANKKRLAYRVFKLADAQANGRLGAIEAFGGAGKTAFLCNHKKNLQFGEIHATFPAVLKYKAELSKVEQR
jgi:hypothetical protein